MSHWPSFVSYRLNMYIIFNIETLNNIEHNVIVWQYILTLCIDGKLKVGLQNI